MTGRDGVANIEMPLARFGAIELRDQAAALVHCRQTFPEVDKFAFRSNEAPRLQSAGVNLGGIRISAARSTGHLISLTDDRHITVLLPFRRAISVASYRHEARATPGGIIVTDVGSRNTEVAEGYCGGVIKIPKQQIVGNSNLLGEERRLSAIPDLGGEGRTSADLESLRRYLLFLFNELEESDTLMGHQRTRANCAAMLVNMVRMAFLEHTDPIEGTAERRTASLRQVQMAEQRMREGLGDVISIADIAEDLEASIRALELAFQRHRRTSPKKFLNELRLDEIRRRLTRASALDTVGSIAFECGVTHLGRLSIRYRQRFDEAPSDTLRQAQRRSWNSQA